MNLHVAAVSSMNYLFLQITKDRITDETVFEEVASFVQNLKHTTLDDETKRVIQQEVIKGNYFDGLSRKTIESLLNSITDDLVGEPFPEISRFYADLFFDHKRHLEGDNAKLVK